MEEIHPSRCKHDQKSMPKEFIGSNGESTADLLFNGHIVSIKVPSKYLCLCTQIVLFSGLVKKLLSEWGSRFCRDLSKC